MTPWIEQVIAHPFFNRANSKMKIVVPVETINALGIETPGLVSRQLLEIDRVNGGWEDITLY